MRHAAKHDVPSLVSVFQRSVHELAVSHYSAAQRAAWAPQDADLAHWQERFDALTTLLAAQGAEIAGFIAYTPQGYIDMLFTAPRFARRGIASLLFTQARSALQARGVDQLTTHASLSAQAFFLGQGFEYVHHEVVERHGERLARALMRCPISIGAGV